MSKQRPTTIAKGKGRRAATEDTDEVSPGPESPTIGPTPTIGTSTIPGRSGGPSTPSPDKSTEVILRELLRTVSALAKNQEELQGLLKATSPSEKTPTAGPSGAPRTVTTTPPPGPVDKEPLPITINDAVKIRMPDPFDGTKRENARTFIRKLEDVFIIKAREFPTEESKIYTLGTLLKDDAANWFYQNREIDPNWVITWAACKERFLTTWNDPDELGTLANKLEACRQDKSAAEFATEFGLITTRLGFNEAAKCLQFVPRLKESVQDELGREPRIINDYNRLVTRAIEIDNLQAARRLQKERSGRGRATQSASGRAASRKTEGADPDPPSKKSKTNDGRSSSAPRKRWAPATEEEKADRKSKGLCEYHGNPPNDCAACEAYHERQRKRKEHPTKSEN